MSREDKSQVRQETRRAARDASQEAKRQSRKLARELSEQAKRASQDIEDDVRLSVEGPIWARAEPGARKPRYTREQLAGTALAIADAEGLDAVSMRRVASELGAGTMTLYHYVRNKDELLGLMHDAVMGELIVPDEEFASGWREALTQIAQRTRDAFMRHPWAWEGRGAGTSPNTMRHIEQSLAAVEDLDADPEQRLEVVALVDDFVFGSVLRAGTRFSDPPSEEELGAILAYVEDQLATGDFPHTRELLGDEDPATFFGRVARRETADARFERGLELLLDGVELQISQK